MDWKESLLDDQVIAASHTGNHARLLAGPGTGKTLVLSRRILYLIHERDVPPEEILALTFTRAAAYELKQRVASALGDENMPRISTLHSFSLRQLLKNSNKLLDLPQPLRIADDWEERYVVLEDLKVILELSKIAQVRELLNQLASDWESLAADQGTFTPDAKFIGAWELHRYVFGYTLRSELVYQLKRAMDQIEDFELEAPLQHLLVDEYQDLNQCDLAVVKSVVGLGLELFIAGDDDQSIYGFRKAHPEGIRRFLDEYEGAVSLPIEVCMRCDADILALGEFVANLDTKRIEKETRPEPDRESGEVALLRFRNQYNEATGIANLCKCLIEKDGYSPSEILVLSRVNTYRAFSAILETAFDKVGIPFAGDLASFSPIDEPEGRMLLAFLRLLRNGSDHLSWRTLLILRKNRIGAGIMQSLVERSLTKRVPFSMVLQEINANVTELSRYGQRVATEYSQIQDFISQLAADFDLDELTSDAFNELIDRVIAFSVEDEEAGMVARDYLLGQFEYAEATSLNGFLPTIEASNERIEQDIDSESVNMLTMHKAKGLSANAVIVMVAEDETIPGRQVDEPGLGDERRLLFVSLTRARHKLFITFCNERVGHQKMLGRESGNQRRTLTQFLRHSPIEPLAGLDFIRKRCAD